MKRNTAFALRIGVTAAVALCDMRLAVADAIAISSPPEHFERTFGDVRIVVGAPRPGDGLRGWLTLYVGGQRIAEYPHLLAQEVYSSPDGSYFFLLSNLGLSSYAIAVIDRQGKVLVSRAHDQDPANGAMHYCRASVTNLREWIVLKDPNARFEVIQDSSVAPSRHSLKSVTVKGCDGRDVVISEPPKNN